MTHELEALLEIAKRHPPSKEQREAQRRIFTYGNAAIENDLITRKMVDEEAEKLDRAKNARSKS